MPQRNRNLFGLIAGTLLVWLLVLAAPGISSAQQIGGTVTDSTLGVLPGVTVEARSPALIEQVRTAITDGSGQYLIVALERGTYTVTYTLPGFSTFVREGIELTSGFSASIDVQLSVGDIQETVTVSGASPVVDIQNVEQRQVMDREIIDSVPTGKALASYGLLIPGMVGKNSFGSALTQDAGGLSLQTRQVMSIHGGNVDDQVIVMNGLEVGDPLLQGAPNAYFPDTNYEEIAFSYSGNTAEHETGGVSISMIPREGANSFSGSLFSAFSFPGMLADNLDQDLIDRGVENAHALEENWVISPSFGGAIVRDRVWFFLTHTSSTANLRSPGVFFAMDPGAFVYEPDLARPSADLNTAREQSLNLTVQATSRDKVKAYWTNSASAKPYTLQGRALGSLFLTPEAAVNLQLRTDAYQVTWTRPQTNRLLFEAGMSRLPTAHRIEPTEGSDVSVPAIMEVSPLRGYRNSGAFLGATSRRSPKLVNNYRASMSYVTGSHNLKVGFNLLEQNTGRVHNWPTSNDWVRFQTFRGAPYRATFYGAVSQVDSATSLGIYAQEQWTLDRLTVNAGLRLDYNDAGYPDQTRPTNKWAPSPFNITGQTAVTWKDFQPRLGVAYDLRGDGRTALKFSANRYGKRSSTDWSVAVNPGASNRQMNRSWFDGATSHAFGGSSISSCIGTTVVCIPGDGIVQGDPKNPLPNGEIVSPNATPGFGLPQVTRYYDPNWAFGWGNRESNWEFSGSIQQELMSGVSLDVAYFRRAWINRHAVDNRAIGPVDFETGTVTAPTDSRLPGGGGGTLSFLDLKPGSIRVPDHLTVSVNDFGGVSEIYNGFDITLDARVENVLLQGGLSTGHVAHDFCGRQSQLPETAGENALEYCNRSQNWLTQVKLLGSYSLPYDVQIAATLQNQPGPERQALANFGAADTNLGRPLVLYPSAIELNLIEPGSLYGQRFNQVDVRLTKIFNLGGTARLRTMFDIFNVLNANAVTIEEPSFGPEWLTPINIMPGRLAKFALQIEF